MFSPNWKAFTVLFRPIQCASRIIFSLVFLLFLLQIQAEEHRIQLIVVHYIHNEYMINSLPGS
jgi:hypothetical protein